VVLGVFGRAIDRRRIDLDLRTAPQLRAEALVAGLAFLIAILVSFALRSAFATRYTAVVVPFIALLLAGGITRFVGRWLRFVVVLCVCAFLTAGALWNIADTRTQAAQVAAAIDAAAQPGDLVIFCPDQLGPSSSRLIAADVDELTYPEFGDPRFVDWVDYKQRNDAADPVQFAHDALAKAGPDHAVFVVWSGSYRTFEGDCEAMVNTLGEARPGQELVGEDGAYFEKAYVHRFPGAG
jgi:hypothetical protein